MPRYFTHYWKNDTWEREREWWESDPERYPLNHAGSNMFVERGVETGDFVYPVTIIGGELYLLGRMRVDKVCDQEEAANDLGTDALGEAKDHIVSSGYTQKRFDFTIPLTVTEQLRFVSGGGTKRLQFSSPGQLDQQTLRGVRGLHPGSAAELDRLLLPARQANWEDRPTFEVGRVYNRSAELHDKYGGQRRGGISTPKDRPFVFLFTGESGEQYGYRDGWEDNGVFLYTGEGQEGDMGFQAGNRAIREHAEEGKDLHLFQSLSKGKGYRYLGMFACPSWEYRRGKDVNGEERWVIVFHLIQQDAMQQDNVTVTPGTGTPIDQLREDAYKAAYRAGEGEPQEAKRRYFHRSAAVHNYVLARASGRCEVCSEPAPFRRSDGTPYLEPHHTRRLADGGPDHPRWVAAICPNCHREIHHGVEGDTKNTRLQWLLGKLEG